MTTAKARRDLERQGQASVFAAAPSPPKDPGWRPPEPPQIASAGITEVYLDLETTGLRWWGRDRPIGWAVGTEDGRTWYLPTGHAGGNLAEERVLEWAKVELRGVRLTGANVRFDAHMALAAGVDLEAQGCSLHDVGHAAALLDDHRRSTSLESLAQEAIGRGKLVGDLDVTRLAERHAGDVASYAMMDVALTREVDLWQRPRLEAEGLGRVVDLEDAAIWPVVSMEQAGAPIDEELLRRWAAETEQEYLRCLWRIHRETGLKVNPNSPGDVAALMAKRGVTAANRTASGAVSLAAESLEGIEDPVVLLAVRARKLDSLRSKFLLKYLACLEGGILRYALHQLRADDGGTVTGRFSSSAYRLGRGEEWGINVQQVPKPSKQLAAGTGDFPVRRLFRAASGLFYSADAKQIEYRLFAHYANSQRILDEYARDPDANFHRVVLAMVSRFKADFPYDAVKNLNFGCLYGAGVSQIASLMRVSLREAERFKQIYDTAFPEVNQLMRLAMRIAERDGHVKTLLGRRSRFPRAERLHKAVNSILQGSAADVMKKKLVELHAERRRTGMTMRFTVHDEVCADAPDAASAAMATEILNRQSFKLSVPILWDAGVGETWEAA